MKPQLHGVMLLLLLCLAAAALPLVSAGGINGGSSCDTPDGGEAPCKQIMSWPEANCVAYSGRCGPGVHQGLPLCINVTTNEYIPYIECNEASPPLPGMPVWSKPCYDYSCLEWFTGDFDTTWCSSPCLSSGYYYREVRCRNITGDYFTYDDMCNSRLPFANTPVYKPNVNMTCDNGANCDTTNTLSSWEYRLGWGSDVEGWVAGPTFGGGTMPIPNGQRLFIRITKDSSYVTVNWSIFQGGSFVQLRPPPDNLWTPKIWQQDTVKEVVPLPGGDAPGNTVVFNLVATPATVSPPTPYTFSMEYAQSSEARLGSLRLDTQPPLRTQNWRDGDVMHRLKFLCGTVECDWTDPRSFSSSNSMQSFDILLPPAGTFNSNDQFALTGAMKLNATARATTATISPQALEYFLAGNLDTAMNPDGLGEQHTLQVTSADSSKTISYQFTVYRLPPLVQSLTLRSNGTAWFNAGGTVGVFTPYQTNYDDFRLKPTSDEIVTELQLDLGLSFNYMQSDEFAPRLHALYRWVDPFEPDQWYWGGDAETRFNWTVFTPSGVSITVPIHPGVDANPQEGYILVVRVAGNPNWEPPHDGYRATGSQWTYNWPPAEYHVKVRRSTGTLRLTQLDWTPMGIISAGFVPDCERKPLGTPWNCSDMFVQLGDDEVGSFHPGQNIDFALTLNSDSDDINEAYLRFWNASNWVPGGTQAPNVEIPVGGDSGSGGSGDGSGGTSGGGDNGGGGGGAGFVLTLPSTLFTLGTNMVQMYLKNGGGHELAYKLFVTVVPTNPPVSSSSSSSTGGASSSSSTGVAPSSSSSSTGAINNPDASMLGMVTNVGSYSPLDDSTLIPFLYNGMDTFLHASGLVFPQGETVSLRFYQEYPSVEVTLEAYVENSDDGQFGNTDIVGVDGLTVFIRRVPGVSDFRNNVRVIAMPTNSINGPAIHYILHVEWAQSGRAHLRSVGVATTPALSSQDHQQQLYRVALTRYDLASATGSPRPQNWSDSTTFRLAGRPDSEDPARYHFFLVLSSSAENGPLTLNLTKAEEQSLVAYPTMLTMQLTWSAAQGELVTGASREVLITPQLCETSCVQRRYNFTVIKAPSNPLRLVNVSATGAAQYFMTPAFNASFASPYRLDLPPVVNDATPATALDVSFGLAAEVSPYTTLGAPKMYARVKTMWRWLVGEGAVADANFFVVSAAWTELAQPAAGNVKSTTSVPLPAELNKLGHARLILWTQPVCDENVWSSAAFCFWQPFARPTVEIEVYRSDMRAGLISLMWVPGASSVSAPFVPTCTKPLATASDQLNWACNDTALSYDSVALSSANTKYVVLPWREGSAGSQNISFRFVSASRFSATGAQTGANNFEAQLMDPLPATGVNCRGECADGAGQTATGVYIPVPMMSTGRNLAEFTCLSASKTARAVYRVWLTLSSATTYAPPIPAPVVVVSVAPEVDPCTIAASNPCNGLGTLKCESAISANSTIVRVPGVPIEKTIQCRCRKGFFGDACDVGLLTDSVTSRMKGNVTLSFFMVGAMRALQRSNGIVVLGRAIDFTVSTITASSNSEAVKALQRRGLSGVSEVDEVSFVVPSYFELMGLPAPGSNTSDVSPMARALKADSTPVRSVYETVQLTVGFTSGSEVKLHSFNATGLLYFSVSECLGKEGPESWWPDGAGGCTFCPRGCDCIGGGRCLPLPGYWSYNENQLPFACNFADACPGGAAQQMTSDGVIYTNTQVCTAGYTGAGCATCDDGYFQQNGRCIACGGTDQTAQMVSMIIAAAAVTLCLSIGVATLEPLHLVWLVLAFTLTQQLSAVGAQGALSIPEPAGSALATLFTWLSLTNFNLEILRPGCSIPRFTFITLFLGTLVLILFTAAMFVISCLVRLFLQLRWGRAGQLNTLSDDARLLLTQAALQQAKVDPTRAAMNSKLFVVAPWEDFRRRCTHSLLILCTIFFLKLTTLQMKLMQCTYAPAPADALLQVESTTKLDLYLKTDLQTLCWRGTHLGVVMLSFVIFIVYTLGFPLTTFILLTRALADEHTDGRIGWLRKRFKILRRDKTATQQRLDALKAMEDQEAQAEQLAAQGGNGGAGSSAVVDSSVALPPQANRQSSTCKASLDRKGTHITGGAGGTLTRSQQKKIALLYLEHERIGYFGFLFLDVREEMFPYRLAALITNFAFAVVTNWVSNIPRQLFALGCVFAWDALVVAWFLPFKKWMLNAKAGCVAIALIAQNGLLLGVATNEADGGPDRVFFIVLAVIFGLLLILLSGRDRLIRALNRCANLHIRISEEHQTANERKIQPYLEGAAANGGAAAGGNGRRNEFLDDDDEEDESEVRANREDSLGKSAATIASVRQGVPNAWGEQTLAVATVQSALAADEAAAAAAEAEANRLEAVGAQETSTVRLHHMPLEDEVPHGARSPGSVDVDMEVIRVPEHALRVHPESLPSPSAKGTAAPLASHSRKLSTLPPSSAFPDVPVTDALNLAFALSDALAMPATPRSGRSPAERRTASWQQAFSGGDAAAAATAVSASDHHASQRMLQVLLASRTPEQQALLHTIWQNPALQSVLEAQLNDLIGVAQRLFEEVVQLLNDEGEAAGQTSVAVSEPSRVLIMVQHLLAQQRPDLRQTCVEHLLATSAEFEPLQAAIAEHAQEKPSSGEGASAQLASASVPDALQSPTPASVALQRALVDASADYMRSISRLVRPTDLATKQQYQLHINKLNVSAAALAAAAEKMAPLPEHLVKRKDSKGSKRSSVLGSPVLLASSGLGSVSGNVAASPGHTRAARSSKLAGSLHMKFQQALALANEEGVRGSGRSGSMSGNGSASPSRSPLVGTQPLAGSGASSGSPRVKLLTNNAGSSSPAAAGRGVRSASTSADGRPSVSSVVEAE